MTGVSVAQASGEALVRAHGPALQRTAVMLTGQPAVAEGLVAEVLQGAAGPRPPALEELRRRLVRAHRRSGRTGARDRLAVTDAPSDVGDLLHDLPPRQRAALVLHLAEDVPLGDAARTARVPERRVRRLVETVPELGEALRAVADRHARPDHEVIRALLDRLPTDATTVGRATPYRSSLLRRPRRWLAGATAVAVLGAGTVAALTWPQETPETPETPGDGVTSHLPPGTGPAPADLVLGADGEPPRSVDGLRLSKTVTIDYRRATDPLDLSGFGGASGYARWAVLWCDLPAVDDDHLRIPQLTLDLAGAAVELPCAGRGGIPTRLTALPIGLAGHVPVAWSGDLPGRGSATLALYGETDPWAVTRRPGTQPVPPVADGAAAVTAADVAMQGWEGPVHTRVLEVGHESTLTVWAGSSLALSVLVDDVRLTDDGDLRARYLNPPPDLWRTQDPSLREGRWVVVTPDQLRTFPLPEAVRPGPGERRAVAVTVALSPADTAARWQVQVSDTTAPGTPGPELALRPGRPAAVAASTAPDAVGGARLVGSWSVPQDGVPHPVEAPVGDLETLIVAVPGAGGEEMYDELAMGSLERADRAVLFPVGPGVGELLAWGLGPWQDHAELRPTGGPSPDDALSLRLPPVPGHPPTDVLAYLPVPYEDFDMSGAPLLPTSWLVDDPSPFGDTGMGGPSPVVVPEPRPDGTFVVDESYTGAGTTLEVTTRGRGRLRVLADGEPLTHLSPAHDGWWSTWTDAHVVSRVDVWADVSGAELVLEVQGWEEGFELAVIRW
ncbi:hypothetical protein [Ornithinimicrobium cerasi]|uniref:DNA-directed RNA polymerase specialized sigma subunit, sigma24 family n=1 Tax=Ornithinimicrobium cerasi TaxID=2248773 RepID=A0A285VG76_9MICO|nr:hypothetical protein [Ornithinimicrobium cerasi]SOC52578.1 DNA-directed RNA polymerase specialized sigma subunit, sigma24 family [Ornithinimicrobium cerasi]